MRDQLERIAFDESDDRIVRIADARGVLGNGVQHRLKIRRRAGDDTQDLTRRGLLLQRLGEVAVAPSSSLNSRTFSMAITAWSAKVSSSLICARGEGAHLGAPRVQRSNEFPLLTKGSGQEGAPAAGGTQHWEIVLRADVGNMERAMLAHPAITVVHQY